MKNLSKTWPFFLHSSSRRSRMFTVAGRKSLSLNNSFNFLARSDAEGSPAATSKKSLSNGGALAVFGFFWMERLVLSAGTFRVFGCFWLESVVERFRGIGKLPDAVRQVIWFE